MTLRYSRAGLGGSGRLHTFAICRCSRSSAVLSLVPALAASHTPLAQMGGRVYSGKRTWSQNKSFMFFYSLIIILIIKSQRQPYISWVADLFLQELLGVSVTRQWNTFDFYMILKNVIICLWSQTSSIRTLWLSVMFLSVIINLFFCLFLSSSQRCKASLYRVRSASRVT